MPKAIDIGRNALAALHNSKRYVLLESGINPHPVRVFRSCTGTLRGLSQAHSSCSNAQNILMAAKFGL